MNRAAFEQGKPIVECAMYDMEYQITTMIPGETPCLRCLYPEDPPGWKRKFPVFGAVSGTVACLGAVEAIKLISGIGDPSGQSPRLRRPPPQHAPRDRNPTPQSLPRMSIHVIRCQGDQSF